MAIDDQDEFEVTLRHHQDHLLQSYNGFKLCRFDEISAEPDDVSDADPLSCHSAGIDYKAVAVDLRSKKEKPHRRRCLAKCISLVFLLGAGAAIYTVWQLGIVGSLKHRVNSASANVENEYLGLPTYTPSMQPSTSPEPTVAPSMIPSRQPSVSFVPTTAAPSQLPTLSPKPSGSMLPSSLPSAIPSSFPSEPTASPSPSLPPTQHPSLVPSDASSSTPSILQSDAPRICNGLASNCNRRANDIMYATSHNAMSSQVDGFIAFNHLKNMEDSMEAGFRGFLIDSCDCGEDGIKFCHEVCAGGTRDPETLFLSVVSFMYKNPHDIIVIELQIGDNSLWGLWEQTPSQFRDLTYTHTGESDPWPTLNELIDMGRRIIVLQHNGPNCDVPGQCPEGVQGLWRYGFETNWDLSTVKDVEDYANSCTVKTGIASRPHTFMLNNHFANSRIGLPSRGISEIINEKDFLQARLDACTEIVGRRTNFLAVDFWSIGDVVEVVNLNNAALPEGENIFVK